ncbi:MAG TPA: hypothetical protein VEZ90_20135 [Blastocatellia bacterium]|nr:hypothetical protein [Blastocatellia bacterium]
MTVDPSTGKKVPDSPPDWNQTAREVGQEGYRLDRFGDNEVTGNSGPPNEESGDAFNSALKNSELVIYVGHGYGPDEHPFEPLAIEVGTAVYDSNGEQDFVTGRGVNLPKPDTNAAAVCNFSCNSATRSDYFNFTGDGFQASIAVDSGKEGNSALGTLEKAANAFVKAYAKTKGSKQDKTLAGIAAAQRVFDSSGVPIDRGDKVVVYELRSKMQ